VKGITGESFVPESLILSEGISALYDDAGLRTTILATLPTLDESGVAVRQTGGRDPHRGIRISDAPAGGPQSAGVAPAPPPELPAPPPRAAPGCRRKRGDAGCATPTICLFRTLSERKSPARWRNAPALNPKMRRGLSVLPISWKMGRTQEHTRI
jgi:hypothetical protein